MAFRNIGKQIFFAYTFVDKIVFYNAVEIKRVLNNSPIAI